MKSRTVSAWRLCRAKLGSLTGAAVAGLAVAAGGMLSGCGLFGGPVVAVIEAAPLGEAYECAKCAPAVESIRIDLADQETEGFHFMVPEAALAGGGIDRWEIELRLPAAEAAAGKPGDAAAAPVEVAPVKASGLGRYYLAPHFYDCLTVANPMAAVAQQAGTPEHVPDALLPMRLDGDAFRSQLAAGDGRASRHVWVELSWRMDEAGIQAEPERRLAGAQEFKVIGFDADGVKRLEIGVNVRLHAFTLPVTGRFRTMLNWNTTIAGYYGWQEITPAMRRRYYDFFLQYRLSPTSFHSQAMEPAAEDLGFCAERGLNALNLYTVDRQKGPLPQEETEAIRKIGESAKAALEQNNLLNSAFVLVCNTAEESDVDSINANADAVHTDLPWAKVWLFAAPNEVLSQRINAWSTLTVADTSAFHSISYDAEARAKYSNAKDLSLWYVGQEPVAPHVNLLLSNRPFHAHALALQTWANAVNGVVVPHATAWPWGRAAQMNFPATEWQARRDGYGLLCYPLPDGGPCPSVRLTNLRDGLEHAEALRTAELLSYNLDTEQKLFEKITVPALNEQLKSFDNVAHTDDLRQRIQAKLRLTQEQLAAMPAKKAALDAILAEYKTAFSAVDGTPDSKQAEATKHLRRRLYRAIDEAAPLNDAIVKNINDPVAPADAPAAPPANEAPAAPAEPPAAG